MTREEFTGFCSDICPQCAAGMMIRQRDDTSEWVHESLVKLKTGHFMSHHICYASHFRNKWQDRLDLEIDRRD